MPYDVRIKSSAEKELIALPLEALDRVRTLIDELAIEPRPSGVRKLSGSHHRYRLRVGDYRVIYEITDSIRVVTIIRIGHRRDVYRER